MTGRKSSVGRMPGRSISAGLGTIDPGAVQDLLVPYRPLRELFKPCEDRLLALVELAGVGITQEAATTDLENEEQAFDRIGMLLRFCDDKTCGVQEAACGYDSGTIGEPDCKQVQVMLKRQGVEIQAWVCRRTTVWGCFCSAGF